jgi:cell division protein FtsL
MVRRIPSRQRNALIARERDPGALIRLALLLFSGLVLAGGFLYAGRQHFMTLKLGYETEKLRNIRAELAEEQRRFLLEREAAASPARLERAARQLGMQPMQPAQIDPLKRALKSSDVKTGPEPTDAATAPARDAQTKLIRQPKPPTNRPGNKPI